MGISRCVFLHLKFRRSRSHSLPPFLKLEALGSLLLGGNPELAVLLRGNPEA